MASRKPDPKLLADRLKARRAALPSIEDWVTGIRTGNRSLLSQAITVVESRQAEHQAIARRLLDACLPYTGQAIRVGITGVPGVGKSTFIEAFGVQVTAEHHKLAVLAIDPSSERTGGSILGDKTRMNELAVNPNVFIRPSPSAGSLGGVARKTRESMILFEAAGYDVIVVETVGVGQSETAVHSMVDFFLLLMLAGAGDELQGIKRGIMEMAEAILITKADGSNLQPARQARRQYKNALHLFPAAPSGWTTAVEVVSAIENKGLNQAWNIIKEYRDHTERNGYFTEKRKSQARYWMQQTIEEELKDQFYAHPAVKQELTALQQSVTAGELSPFHAAEKLLKAFRNKA